MAFASMQRLSAAPNAALSQPQRSERVPAAAAFRAGQPLKLRATQQRVALAARSGHASHVCCAAQAQAGPGKLISSVEIPAFIPRQDLLDQLLRWAVIEVQEGGAANLGNPCKVTPYYVEGNLWGFTTSFLKDGVSASDVRVAFDLESVTKHEWVGRGADGFPTLEGNSEEVLGKNFEIRKIDDNPLSDNLRSSIRDFCQQLVAAINKYYAFGSAFSDDST